MLKHNQKIQPKSKKRWRRMSYSQSGMNTSWLKWQCNNKLCKEITSMYQNWWQTLWICFTCF